MLIVMTGLPGTGKSAIADGIARALRLPVFSVDPLEAALLRTGITREHRSDYAAYELVSTLAESQLRLGQSAVVDAVNSLAWLRGTWRDLASRFGARTSLIECVCSDPSLHRSRLEHRKRDIPGFVYEPDWSQVVQRGAEFEPCLEDRLVLDSVRPFEDNLQQAVDYIALTR